RPPNAARRQLILLHLRLLQIHPEAGCAGPKDLPLFRRRTAKWAGLARASSRPDCCIQFVHSNRPPKRAVLVWFLRVVHIHELGIHHIALSARGSASPPPSPVLPPARSSGPRPGRASRRL